MVQLGSDTAPRTSTIAAETGITGKLHIYDSGLRRRAYQPCCYGGRFRGTQLLSGRFAATLYPGLFPLLEWLRISQRLH